MYVPLIVRALKLLVFDSVFVVPDRVIVPPLAVNVPPERVNDPPTVIVPPVIENVPLFRLKFLVVAAPPLIVMAIPAPRETVPPETVSEPRLFVLTLTVTAPVPTMTSSPVWGTLPPQLSQLVVVPQLVPPFQVQVLARARRSPAQNTTSATNSAAATLPDPPVSDLRRGRTAVTPRKNLSRSVSTCFLVAPAASPPRRFPPAPDPKARHRTAPLPPEGKGRRKRPPT